MDCLNLKVFWIMELSNVIPPYSILDECFELFDGNLKALSIAVSDRHKDTPKLVLRNLSRSNWKAYEKPLTKCTELYRRDILAYISLSNIDYAECSNTLESTYEYIRLSDFHIEATKASRELKNLEHIIDYAKRLHSLIARTQGKEVKYHAKVENSLFGDEF